jgi:uncharacterized protein (DUF2225 family)
MPRWVVTCPLCWHVFTHTNISAGATQMAAMDPFRIIAKPTIAPDGETLLCPKCEAKSTFHRFDLSYRGDT